MTPEEMNQTDGLVQRNRSLRWAVAIVTPIIMVIVGQMLGAKAASMLYLPSFLGSIPGMSLGLASGVWLFSTKSFVRNPAVTAFLTVNPVAGWFKGDTLVCYGPGSHPSYWWEQRDGKNTFSLEEVSHKYTVTVQCKDGTLKVEYEIRLRADITKSRQFIAGVASVSSEIGSLVGKSIIEFLGNKSVRDALTKLAVLNEKLATEFSHGTGILLTLEDRLGVIVGDVTVGEMLPSAEVQRTMSSQTEMSVIDKIVRQSLKTKYGVKTDKALNDLIASGKITPDSISKLEKLVMSASGNADGIDLSDANSNFNLNITGLDKIDPSIAEAIKGFAPIATAISARQATGAKPRIRKQKPAQGAPE